MERPHLRQPTVDPSLRPRGHEHDVAIGEEGGLDVIPRAIGELAQPGSVGSDLVEMVVAIAGRQVREDDTFARGVNLWVSNAPLLVLQENTDFACREVQRA
jgi:hypothetical protein